MKTKINSILLSALLTCASTTAFAAEIDETLPATNIPTGSSIEFTRDLYIPVIAPNVDWSAEPVGNTLRVSCTFYAHRNLYGAGKSLRIQAGSTKTTQKLNPIIDDYDGIQLQLNNPMTLAINCISHEKSKRTTDYPSIHEVREALQSAGLMLNLAAPTVPDAVDI